jgi:hypothetical protein
MRYSLRNQNKIKNAFGDKFLRRLTASLESTFEDCTIEELDVQENIQPYPILCVHDASHIAGMILFYVVSKTLDVYNLAFKETIN